MLTKCPSLFVHGGLALNDALDAMDGARRTTVESRKRAASPGSTAAALFRLGRVQARP
jgi:hypothetical protein